MGWELRKNRRELRETKSLVLLSFYGVVGRILRVIGLPVLVCDCDLDMGRRIFQVADRVGGEAFVHLAEVFAGDRLVFGAGELDRFFFSMPVQTKV